MALYREALTNAATLLAGKRGEEAAEDLLDQLRLDSRPTRRAIRIASDLLDVLSLRHVDDLERPEATYFARIDPADPWIEDVCCLTEFLAEALARTLSDDDPGIRTAA